MDHKKESPTMRTKGNKRAAAALQLHVILDDKGFGRKNLTVFILFCDEQIDPLLRLMLTRAPFKPDPVLIRTHFYPNHIEHVFKRPILTRYPNEGYKCVHVGAHSRCDLCTKHMERFVFARRNARVIIFLVNIKEKLLVSHSLHHRPAKNSRIKLPIMDKALLETKAALGIETTVNLLCDPSYLGYLASTKKKKVHGYVAKMFGVNHVMFDTTQCIMKHLKNCGSADETFKKLEQKVSGFVCTHFKTALEPESCLLDVINGEHAEPFILASVDEEICRKMQERTGVPVLTLINGKKTVMIPSLPQLERMKQQRIERVEARKKIELEKRMAFEAYLKEEERKQKEAKAGETSSKKGKAKNKQDKALLETKAALGIETKVRLLCDPSYFRYLASIVEDAQDLLYTLPEKKNVHGDVTKMFGVDHVTLDTTQCVMKHLKKCGPADGNAHVVECAQMVRCFVCTHFKTALEPESCLLYVIQWEHAEPYILASVDEESYRKMQEMTGVPVLTVINGKKRIIVPSLPQLERIKQQRIERVEAQKKIEFEKRMDFEAYLKEKERKQKEAKAGETSSKRGKAKKKQ